MVTKFRDHSLDMITIKKDLEKIKEKIIKNEYYICYRKKNELFKRRFRFNKKSDFKTILLSLTESDFNKCDEEEQIAEFGKGLIYVFIKKCSLINIHGETESLNIYIKIKIPIIEKDLPVISFHVAEY